MGEIDFFGYIEPLVGMIGTASTNIAAFRPIDSAIEMASWRNPGHAISARMVLGRVVGIPKIV
jgi:hypothetical protein